MENRLYIEYRNKIKELNNIEEHIPDRFEVFVAEIDKYIFAAGLGFQKATEAYIIVKDIVQLAQIKYELKLSNMINELKENGETATTIKDHAKALSIDEKENLIKADNLNSKAEIIRNMWKEKLMTFKKIKSDNFNEQS